MKGTVGKRYSLKMVEKREGETMLISDKIDIKPKTVRRTKKDTIMITGQRVSMLWVYVCAQNN